MKVNYGRKEWRKDERDRENKEVGEERERGVK